MQHYKLDITNCDLKSKYKPSSLADVNWVREERISSSSGRDVAAFLCPMASGGRDIEKWAMVSPCKKRSQAELKLLVGDVISERLIE